MTTVLVTSGSLTALGLRLGFVSTFSRKSPRPPDSSRVNCTSRPSLQRQWLGKMATGVFLDE